MWKRRASSGEAGSIPTGGLFKSTETNFVLSQEDLLKVYGEFRAEIYLFNSLFNQLLVFNW